MFLRSTKRWKDGKEHYYWSLVENRRCRGNRVVQHTVLYLGEISDSQKEQWIRAIEVFDEESGQMEQMRLFAAERVPAGDMPQGVRVQLKDFELRRPRQWGGCWLFTEVWKELGLEGFWREKLGVSREGTDWEHVLQTLCCYRLLDPGSEWRPHRVWFDQCAMGDLLGEDVSVAAKDTLYRCMEDRIEAHIFIALLAFCLHAALRHKLRLKAPGLTPRWLSNSRPSRCSMSTSRPPTAAISSSSVTPPRAKPRSSCSPSWDSNCHRSPRPASPPSMPSNPSAQSLCSEDLDRLTSQNEAF
jgi:hypothetical protein